MRKPLSRERTFYLKRWRTMSYRAGILLLCIVGLVMGAPGAPPMPARTEPVSPASLPVTDTRAAVPPATLNTPRAFPVFHSLAEWQARRETIRQQILISCGLT